jgi:hypothetical protein
MSLRVALGCHPLLGEDDAHLRNAAQALGSVGAEVAILADPEQFPDDAPDVVHYAGPFHVQSAVALVAHAQRVEAPFFLTCRFGGSHRNQDSDLQQRGQAAAIAAAKILFAPASTADAVRAEVGREDLLALPEMPDSLALDAADPDGFRAQFHIHGPYLLLIADRLEAAQQQHLILAAAKMAGMQSVVLSRTSENEYRARCDTCAAPGTVYAGALGDALRGGAVLGAAAALMAPRHGDHATPVLTALAADLPVVAGPGTAVPDCARNRVTFADPSIPSLFAEAIGKVLRTPRSTPAGKIGPSPTPDRLGCTLLRGYGAIPAGSSLR